LVRRNDVALWQRKFSPENRKIVHVRAVIDEQQKTLHVVERFKLVDGGEALDVRIHVGDPGAFTMP
jgi:hypothetical protein